MGIKQRKKMHNMKETISGMGYMASMQIPTTKAITEIKNKLPVCLSDKTL
jgi:hypothetical protein